MAIFPLILALVFLASCSPKKPVYDFDFGARRSPQDNQSIINSMSPKQQEKPKPPLPGYDIPAPRYGTPVMIDAPGSEMTPQPSLRQYPQGAPPPTTQGRRRPAKQFSYFPAIANPPTTVSAASPSLFDRIKNVFQRQPAAPQRIPGGMQPYPVDRVLEGELEGLPSQAFAGDEVIPEGKTIAATPASVKVAPAKPIAAKPKQGLQFKVKTPEQWSKEDQKQAKPQVKPAASPVKSTVKPTPGSWKNPDNTMLTPIKTNTPAKPVVKNIDSEDAEVLMEFDISEDGKLVNLQDLAPAAGNDATAR